MSSQHSFCCLFSSYCVFSFVNEPVSSIVGELGKDGVVTLLYYFTGPATN